MKLLAAFLVASMSIGAAVAQTTIQAPTRVTTFDWQCQDVNGAKISDHTRFDTAFVACYNNPAGDRVQGGTYKLNKLPPVEPECPAKPADETQTVQCPTGFTGSWTQVRSYISAVAPTCWTAGPWTPATAPDGACTAIPPALTAPVLSALTSVPNANDPTRVNISMTWTAVDGATHYEVRRCTGVNCTGYTLIASNVTLAQYTNSNVPSGTTYKFEVRAMQGTVAGPMSNISILAVPLVTAPTGSAVLEWTPPTENTDGTALTDLAGYHVAYGTSSTNLDRTVQVTNPALMSYIVDGLAPGTWYFAVRAYNSAGAQSANSNIASKVIQ